MGKLTKISSDADKRNVEPGGAAVVVYRQAPQGVEFLLLHRGHEGPDYEGDWAWTAPAGERMPGESVAACAQRELFEEAGIDLPIRPLSGGPLDWGLFALEVPADTEISLDSDHDRFEWVSLETVLERCKPERVAKGFEWIARQIGV